MKLLFAEDDPKLGEFTLAGLRAEGFTVDWVTCGDEALDLLSTQPYDAALLDIMLPGPDGLSILRTLREGGNNVPVILLTARGRLQERVDGLNLGADDYLPKPFHLEELVARLRAMWRRGSGDGHSLLSVGDLVANLMTREVKRGDRVIELTSQEFALLVFFMRSPGRIRTRPEILDNVWDYQFNSGSNIVDVYVRKLRKLIDDRTGPGMIETIRGAGYRMKDLRA